MYLNPFDRETNLKPQCNTLRKSKETTEESFCIKRYFGQITKDVYVIIEGRVSPGL